MPSSDGSEVSAPCTDTVYARLAASRYSRAAHMLHYHAMPEAARVQRLPPSLHEPARLTSDSCTSL
jgi:hypothetical protein